MSDFAKDTNVPTNDCISRKAALEAMDTWDKFRCDPNGKLVRCDDDKHYILYVHYEDMVHAIKNSPSAEPLTEEDYTELRDRFGEYVEFVVRDMISGKGERWK